MLIREFTEQDNIDLESVDLLDDLQFFMNNDPAFYRKIYYPTLSKMMGTIKEGAQCNDTIFRPCVDQAVSIYCKKFNIPDNVKSVFTDVDRDALARKIFGQELGNIEQGIYDQGNDNVSN